MSEIEKREIQVEGATVPFYTYKDGDIEYFEFDTSRCGPPEPMVNAMAGLKLITDSGKKLVMVNHKKPMGLLDKIGENFNIEIENLPDGRVKLLFSFKDGDSQEADLTQTNCHG